MGLDNGVIIKNFEEKNVKYPWFIDVFWESNISEICYWRKHWGLRNDFIEALGGENDEGYYELTIDDIKSLIKILKRLLVKKNWEESMNSDYWNWSKNFLITYIRQIINLKWLIWYWKKNPDLEVYFYDSY